MDTLGTNIDTAEELIAFRAALAENVASVVDSLEAIGEELAVSQPEKTYTSISPTSVILFE